MTTVKPAAPRPRLTTSGLSGDPAVRLSMRPAEVRTMKQPEQYGGVARLRAEELQHAMQRGQHAKTRKLAWVGFIVRRVFGRGHESAPVEDRRS